MELMEVYHEAMVTWIIARVTSGKCEGAEFVFGLIESDIRKEATEILLTPVQELDMVRMDFGRLHCYYRQPEITRAQFAYLAIYLVLVGNVAAEEAHIERLFCGSDGSFATIVYLALDALIFVFLIALIVICLLFSTR